MNINRIHPKSLQVAVTLSEIGSATDTAQALHISQPGVSYHLRKLETALGVRLFRRGAGGIIPTQVGELLVNRARTVLGELERLTRDVQGMASGTGQTVRLSSACFTNYHWLPRSLTAFRTRWGDVHIELDVDPSRRPFEALDRGTLDIALTTVPPIGGAFTLQELFQDEIVAVMHPDHSLANHPHLKPGDFEDQSVVVFDRTQSDLFNLTLAPAGVRPRKVTDVPVTEALLELVRAGASITAMASWVARPHLDSGALRGVRIGPEGLGRTWFAVTSSREPPSVATERFVEILVEMCREESFQTVSLARPHLPVPGSG